MLNWKQICIGKFSQEAIMNWKKMNGLTLYVFLSGILMVSGIILYVALQKILFGIAALFFGIIFVILNLVGRQRKEWLIDERQKNIHDKAAGFTLDVFFITSGLVIPTLAILSQALSDKNLANITGILSLPLIFLFVVRYAAQFMVKAKYGDFEKNEK